MADGKKGPSGRDEKIDPKFRARKGGSDKKTERGKKLVRKWVDSIPVAGYVLRWGESPSEGVAPYANLAEFQAVAETIFPAWLRERFVFDLEGVILSVDLAGTTTATMLEEKGRLVDRFTDRTIEVDLGLDQGDIDHLKALVAKEKFTIDEGADLAFVKRLRDKLNGFTEAPLFEETGPKTKGAIDQPLTPEAETGHDDGTEGEGSEPAPNE
jgi:hypothetical protein